MIKMNEEILKQIIINTIKGEEHLGENLKEQCVDYIEQLQNNWNELKKWLETRINTDKEYERNSHIKEKLQVEDYVIKQVMFFMQELEGNNE